MAEPIYGDSVFRFTDPLRYFKANDPYYFEVDNIPLKQLQENCLWLKDQLTKSTQGSLGIKRTDLDELRPYANGGDRILRVKPGRFTARINDASTKEPLQFLNKVFGVGGAGHGDSNNTSNDWPEFLHRISAWEATTASPGSWPSSENPSWNTLLYNSLEKFKSNLAQDALGMTGLSERVFTWPSRLPGHPLDGSGIPYNAANGSLNYSTVAGIPQVQSIPTLATQALLWAKSTLQENFMATTYDQEGGTGSTNQKWSLMPKAENQLVKKWRGITRNAIVDVPDEITVEVPLFDPTDFNYIDENGNQQSVDGVQSRIDMVFIYSKPVDASGIKYLKGTAIQSTTTPALGIVRGAGIKMDYRPVDNLFTDYDEIRATDSAGNTQILAAAGDVNDTNLGFTATSANDIAYDIRGSFPSPDDILNIAPLIQERLADNAIELVGQSILPVAYVWVQGDSSLVAVTDVIDIRPLFRTAELSYNERAGIAAAVPQISLANPVCSLSLMENRSKNLYNYLNSRINQTTDPTKTTRTVATGYIFGGWNFGPEGALYDFEYKNSEEEPRTSTGSDTNIGATNPTIRNTLAQKYHFGGGNIDNVPDYPDWEVADWAKMAENNLTDIGYYPTDYTTPYMSLAWAGGFGTDGDPSIAGGSIAGRAAAGYSGSRLKNTYNTENGSTDIISRTFFNYCKKKIYFNKPSWLLDYSIDVDLVNCVGQNYNGARSQSNSTDWAKAGTYFGSWVEKGNGYFIIYYAWNGDEINALWGMQSSGRYHIQVPIEGTDGVIFTERTSTYASEAYAGGFIVPVESILEADTNKMIPSFDGRGGYAGNPRVGKCSLPTVMWKMTAVGTDDAPYLYTNLNQDDGPPITLNEG